MVLVVRAGIAFLVFLMVTLTDLPRYGARGGKSELLSGQVLVQRFVFFSNQVKHVFTAALFQVQLFENVSLSRVDNGADTQRSRSNDEGGGLSVHVNPF